MKAENKFFWNEVHRNVEDSFEDLIHSLRKLLVDWDELTAAEFKKRWNWIELTKESLENSLADFYKEKKNEK